MRIIAHFSPISATPCSDPAISMRHVMSPASMICQMTLFRSRRAAGIAVAAAEAVRARIGQGRDSSPPAFFDVVGANRRTPNDRAPFTARPSDGISQR